MVFSLQTQLVELQSRYDRLSEAKAKAAARHLDDYQKWKDFKDWLSSTSGSLTRTKGGLNISPKKRKAIMAGITDRKANRKKSKNKKVANLDFLSTPILDPLTPGPSGVKVSDPSDTDDFEMDVTDELVLHP